MSKNNPKKMVGLTGQSCCSGYKTEITWLKGNQRKSWNSFFKINNVDECHWKKIKWKKIISTHVNFSNSWFKSLNWKHPIWKNHEV
jgi:hypothetical protein